MTRRRSGLVVLLLVPSLLTACGSGGSHSAQAAPRRSPSADGPPSPSAEPFVPHRATARLAQWHLPYPVARQAVVDEGRAVLMGGGLLDGDRTTDRVLSLDLSSGDSRELPRLAVPVHDTAAGLVSGLPTVVGGGNSSEQSVIQTLRGGVWHLSGRLPTARSDLNVASWRRHAYVIGGDDGLRQPTQVLRLSRAGLPHPIGSLHLGVRYAATARIGSRVFVIGGEVSGRELRTIQRVDLRTGRVTSAGTLPVALGHAMAATIGARILVMGGRVTPSRQTAALWWYDPATGRVRAGGHLPTPLSDAAVVCRGHRVWLLGGETPSLTDTVTVVTVR
jgi:N-acetylneuraminic acid mutarotase